MIRGAHRKPSKGPQENFKGIVALMGIVRLKGPLWGLIVTGILVHFGGFEGDLGGKSRPEGLENHWESTKKH